MDFHFYWGQSRDLYDWLVFGCSLVLTLVGIGGVIVALFTLRKIERQTKATEKQVNHLIASERAWVMVEAKLEQGAGVAWGTDGTNASVELSIFNAGPTPAWVYEQYAYLQVSPRVIASRTEYPSPDFPFTGEGSTEMTGYVNYEIYPLTQGKSPTTWKAWIRGTGIPTPENRLHVYIFGVVRYRDAFSSLRETYFGYCVKANKSVGTYTKRGL